MDKSKITNLNRNFGSLKTSLQRQIKFIESAEEAIQEINIVELNLKLNTVIKYRVDLDALRREYYELEDIEDAVLTKKETELDSVEEELENLEVRFRTLLSISELNDRKNNVESKLNNKNDKSKNCIKYKLPQVPIPEFDGTIQNFELFKSKFNSLIASNESLTDEQRLHYLQSALKGPASKIQAPNDTFKSLFDALESRYHNVRVTSSLHINALLSLDRITHESAGDLRNLVDSVIKHTRALELLDLKQDSLSKQILLNVILQKLDRETRKQYEMTLKTNELSDFDEFIKFLSKRCQILESLNPVSVTQLYNLIDYS